MLVLFWVSYWSLFHFSTYLFLIYCLGLCWSLSLNWKLVVFLCLCFEFVPNLRLDLGHSLGFSPGIFLIMVLSLSFFSLDLSIVLGPGLHFELVLAFDLALVLFSVFALSKTLSYLGFGLCYGLCVSSGLSLVLVLFAMALAFVSYML